LKRVANRHHVAFDKIETQWDLLDAFVRAEDAFFGIGEDDVRLLVVTR